jgi:hypothetical protein
MRYASVHAFRRSLTELHIQVWEMADVSIR